MVFHVQIGVEVYFPTKNSFESLCASAFGYHGFLGVQRSCDSHLWNLCVCVCLYVCVFMCVVPRNEPWAHIQLSLNYLPPITHGTTFVKAPTGTEMGVVLFQSLYKRISSLTCKSFVVLVLGIWVTPGCAQVLFLAGSGEPYGASGMGPRLAVCKASALPTVVFLWPLQLVLNLPLC